MIARSAIVSRAGQLALRRQACAYAQRRGFAASAAAAAPAVFEARDVAGVTVVSKDAQGPATKLAVVAKAGTRYQPAPGLTAGLEGFAFKNTLRRSALRITRETELLGGQLNAYHTREALVLEASFLREHLPYFTELLGEVVSQTQFHKHELDEEIEPVLHLKQVKYSADPLALAVDAAHTAAYHTGLGASLFPTTTTPSHLAPASVAAFAGAAYARPNFAVVADGATQEALAKWVEPFFKGVAAAPTSPLPGAGAASKYYGGQLRTESAAGNAVVLAFPTAGTLSKPDAAAAVLAALLGGQSGIKWTPGFTLLAKAAATVGSGAQITAVPLAYSDASLLTLQVTGPSAAVVRQAAAAAVDVVKSVATGTVAKEDLAKAVAKAKFDALAALEPASAAVTVAGTAALHGLSPLQPAETAFASVTADQIKTLAKKLLDGKASFAAVGDLHVLPFAEDLGLVV